MNRINADILFLGKGEPIENGTVVWQDNGIVYAGSQGDVPKSYADIPATTCPVVMPGLWDCHIHFMGAHTARMEVVASMPQALAGAQSVGDLKATLMAGFTSVREVAGYGCDLAPGVASGELIGPTIYGCHSAISMTAGHGDIHSMNPDHFTDLCAHGIPFTVADGVDACIKAVRKQLRRGARVIKVCASGGVVSDLDHPMHQQFSLEELKAIVAEAARADRVVAAHCHGKAGIMAALQAGCRTIEHGSYLDDECIDLMLEKDAILVATRTILEGCLAMPKVLAPEAYRKLTNLAAAHAESYRRAVKRGVKIAMGTDIFVTIPGSNLAYGKNGFELTYAVEAGMSPLEAIEAATATGPLTVGGQAPLSGQLMSGYEVDMIAVSKNPLDDIGVLSDARNVTHVWKQGKLVKSPK